MDITYIALKKGFKYLTAIIDVYSCFEVGRSLSNSLGAEAILSLLREAATCQTSRNCQTIS